MRDARWRRRGRRFDDHEHDDHEHDDHDDGQPWNRWHAGNGWLAGNRRRGRRLAAG
jgi:hypothetical protein